MLRWLCVVTLLFGMTGFWACGGGEQAPQAPQAPPAEEMEEAAEGMGEAAEEMEELSEERAREARMSPPEKEGPTAGE